MNNNELVALREKMREGLLQKALLDEEIKKIQSRISEILADEAKRQFGEKLAGDVTLDTDVGKFKASISKTVKWDNGKLQAIASTMPWGEAQSLFKIDFSVSEANYKAVQSMRPELAARLDEARSTKYGELTIKPVYED